MSICILYAYYICITAQKMKCSIKDFFSKCFRRKLRIWPHLLKKSLIENFIFCAVYLIHYIIWDTVFQNGPSEICERQLLKNLLGPFLNTLSHIYYMWATAPLYYIISIQYALLLNCLILSLDNRAIDTELKKLAGSYQVLRGSCKHTIYNSKFYIM